MAKEYVEYRDSGYWIAGIRVSLDSVVYVLLEGLSPESILESFDTLYRRTRDAHPLLYQKLEKARQQTTVQS